MKGKKRIGIEVKNSRTWRREYAKTLNEFVDAGLIDRGFVVYRGREPYRSGSTDGLPVEEFLNFIYTDAFANPTGNS